jgi:hypothetical protein
MAKENQKLLQIGRKPKADACKHRLTFNLNDVDYARFLAMFDKTGWTDKARFIKSVLFK